MILYYYSSDRIYKYVKVVTTFSYSHFNASNSLNSIGLSYVLTATCEDVKYLLPQIDRFSCTLPEFFSYFVLH